MEYDAISRTETADTESMRSGAFAEFGRRRLFSLAAAGGAVLALAGCNGMTVQQISQTVVTMFSTAATTVTAFLAQLGVAVPANIVALAAKIQGIAQQVVAGITAAAASGFVQQAFALFQQVTGAVTSLFAGNLPSFVVNAISAITSAFAWLENALGIAPAPASASLRRTGVPAAGDANTILANLNQIIAGVR